MSANDTLRVGIVGLGGICRSRHVPALRKLDDVEIVAVANRSRVSGESAAVEFRIPHVEDTWQELVTRDDLDMALIGTWPLMHKPVTIAALDAGKHVFCQARMAMDYGEARVMYEHAQKHDRVVGLCPVPFGLKYNRSIQRLLHEGVLGEVRLVRVQSFDHAFADPEAPMNWRKDHRLSGQNMHTLGMYIEVVHRWFGWTTSVSAHTDTFVPERIDAAGERVAVEIPDQVLATTIVGDGTPVQYTINAAVRHGEDRIEVYGSEATLRYDVFADEMHMARGEGSFECLDVHTEDYYDVKQWSVERDFVDAIRTGASFHPDFLDGLKYMEVVQAVYDSARTSRTVTLD